MQNIQKYGFQHDGLDGENIARVTAVHKERYQLVCSRGECFARLKSSVYYGGFEIYPTVGDFVEIEYNEIGDSIIKRTIQRKTFFARKDPDPRKNEQAVAANFDLIFILQSLNHDYNLKRLERYLALAWQSGAVPIVALTKADICDDPSEKLRQTQNVSNGAAVYAVSARTGYGMEELRKRLSPGETAVFLGSSGVGKSSLVNALAGEEIMQIGDIREDDSRGRHTTTHRQLIMLKSGVMIIDTPGMRELGMWDASEGIDEAFSDVEQYMGRCRFSDCRHRSEPGCAVRAAIECGELQEERWESYLRLKKETKYSENKIEYMRERQQRHKSMAKEIRRRGI